MEEETVELPANNTKERKRKIYDLLEKGLCNREIAEKTGIPMGTVSYHAANWRKLHKSADKSKKREVVDNADRHLCKTCAYRSSRKTVNNCDYVSITGHMRNCPAERCTKYERGKIKKRKKAEGDMN